MAEFKSILMLMWDRGYTDQRENFLWKDETKTQSHWLEVQMIKKLAHDSYQGTTPSYYLNTNYLPLHNMYAPLNHHSNQAEY